MKKIRDYVNELFRDIPESDRKEAVMDEVVQNLEEKVWDLMDQGKAEEDAINKAIVDFGDIEELKRELAVNPPDNQIAKKDMTKLNLGYSIWGFSLITALFVFINFYYTPKVIWFVYPAFVLAWWPLTMYFHWLRKKEETK
ncbi:permease prefix domain 1-containing protein [Oceanobacillus kapialis]|uniref:Permease prefix domain 1-containing protein n=1 Tax=Oceanobacillus kapialis TaxID=481353 RepID=A0ABW5PXQ4_9BACI